MEQFDLDDLNRDFMSADARETMLELILAWAYLDGALALWVAAKFDIPADKCAVLLGRTDGKGKLRKLQKLYDLQGHKDVAAEIRKSGKIYDEQVARRNTLAHAGCWGSLHSNPERIVFAAYEVHRLGQLAIEVIPLSTMKQSSNWARLYAVQVEGILRAMNR